ncbi:MAG: hypothetical protein TREMPRED_004305 [Tremellales sp. Tagirdzhanova-0007]|nr:MAG: hypothetical protein TREMPRED_004305 [Tremellales sp. Tagirdzhanova-0007]
MTHRSRNGGPARPRRQGASTQASTKTRVIKPPTSSGLRSSPPPLTSTSDNPPQTLLTQPADTAILKVIHRALRETVDSPDFLPAVQRIKSLLYHRKWLEVFGDEALLQAYAGRWVPSRALCFRELLVNLRPVRDIFTLETRENEGKDDMGSASTEIVSLGGGAGSELLAIAAILHACHVQSPSSKAKAPARISWTGIDIGAWQPTLQKFGESLNTEWDLAQHLETGYVRADLLDPADLSLSNILTRSRPRLITLLFTLTELLAQSRSQTISLLHLLTKLTTPGCLLLVIDSASDISECEVGSEGRKWPVWMILDAVLVAGGGGGWGTVRSEDTRWYRLAEGVGAAWPAKLENTRYWMRLHRRL